MDMPTREYVEEMLTDFEAHELIGPRRDIYEIVVCVFKSYLAQGVELEKAKRDDKVHWITRRILLKHIAALEDESQTLKRKGEQLCCRIGALEIENQTLKAQLLRLEA